MGVKKENDGRYSVGMGVQNGNEYKGSQGWRDIFIQLTADGATEDSIEKLEFLRDYAIYHSGEGNPVMPPSVNVWISNNGTTTAVEADDIAYTDGVYTICGIKCSGDSWDFSNAGQGGGGGGLPAYTSADAGKSLVLAEDTEHATEQFVDNIIPEETATVTSDPAYMQETPLSISVSDFMNKATAQDWHGFILRVNGVEYPIVDRYVDASEYSWVTGAWPDPSYEIYTNGSAVSLRAEGMNLPIGSTVTVAFGQYESVPTVSPGWANVVSALPVAAEIYARMQTVLQTAIPAAIASGLGVPYYVQTNMNPIVDTESWDAYTETLKRTVANKGTFVIDGGDGQLFYPVAVMYLDNPASYGYVSFLMTHATNGYTIQIYLNVTTYIHEGAKMFGLGGSFTLVDAPSN